MSNIEIIGMMIWTAIVVICLFTPVRNYIIYYPLYVLRADTGIFQALIVSVLAFVILTIIIIALAFLGTWIGSALMASFLHITGITWLPMP